MEDEDGQNSDLAKIKGDVLGEDDTCVVCLSGGEGGEVGRGGGGDWRG